MAAAVCTPLLLWFYRRTLLGPVNRYTAVLEEVKAFRITDWHLFAKCGEWICAVPALADGRVTEAGGAEVPLAWPASLPPPVDPICRPRRPPRCSLRDWHCARRLSPAPHPSCGPGLVCGAGRHCAVRVRPAHGSGKRDARECEGVVGDGYLDMVDACTMAQRQRVGGSGFSLVACAERAARRRRRCPPPSRPPRAHASLSAPFLSACRVWSGTCCSSLPACLR